MRLALKILLAMSLVGIVAGCVTGPPSSKPFVDLEPSDKDIRLEQDEKLSIAVTGVIQRDSYSDNKADRSLLDSKEDLNQILTGFSLGLAESSSATVHSLYQTNISIICPGLKELKQVGATKWPSDVERLAEGQTCRLPAQLEDSELVAPLRLRGIEYLIVLVGELQKSSLGTRTQFGLVGGPGVAPAVNIEVRTGILFRVTAILYDLLTRVAVMRATASAYNEAAYGVWLTIIPFSISPDEGEYFSMLATAVGREIGSRFANFDTTVEVRETPPPPPARPSREANSQGPGEPCGSDTECQEGLFCFRITGSCQRRE